MAYLFAANFLIALAGVQQELPKAAAGASPVNSSTSAQQALKPFNVLVGTWRGIGQPKRGSRSGAWIETGSWAWEFKKRNQPALVLTTEKGKLIEKIWLRFDEKKRRFLLEAKFTKGEERTFVPTPSPKDSSGKKTDRVKPVSAKSKKPVKLRFLESVPEGTEASRFTLTILSDKRVTLLIEKGKSSFRRVAEIGYTRKGKSLASNGPSGPECVVTGGAGTIRVSYKGKTYFVCCSGCQQFFNDDPEGVLADYRARLEEEKKKRMEK